MKRTIVGVCGSLLLSAAFAGVVGEDRSQDVQGTWSLNNWMPGTSVHVTLKHASGTSRWEWGADQRLRAQFLALEHP